MALKATIFKVELGVADMDRHYYGDHSLTIARHPSETDERLMVRLLAFAWHADPALQFSRGLSTDDEPALWQHSLSGEIEQWIEVGLPDESKLRKASGRAQQVVVYAYGGRGAALWREQNERFWQRLDNLTVWALPKAATDQLASLAERTMSLQCSIQDGIGLVTAESATVTVERTIWAESRTS